MYVIKIKDCNSNKDCPEVSYLSELKFNNSTYNYSKVNSIESREIHKFPSKDLASSLCRWLNRCYPYSFSVINLYNQDEKINIYDCPEDCYEVDKNGNALNDVI